MSRVPDGFRVVDSHPTLRMAHNADTGESVWVRVLPFCPECIGAIGGACGGPDAPYRPAAEGEPCGASDHDDDEPDAYDVLNARSAYRCDGRPWPEVGAR